MTRLGLCPPPRPPSTSACPDTNKVTDWLRIKIRKINVGVPPPKSGGQASNLGGKQLENWAGELQDLRYSWLPGFSPPCAPDMGAMKGNHGSEVGIDKEQGWGTWERGYWEMGD